MAKRKRSEEAEELIKFDEAKVNESDDITNNKEDNPFSKKVTPIDEKMPKVNHNKNNEILSDSDLMGNLIL